MLTIQSALNGHLHIETNYLSKETIKFVIFFFPKLLPNSVAQWIRALTTNLQVISSNTAVAFVEPSASNNDMRECHTVWWFCAITNSCQLNEKSILVCKQTLNAFLCCFCFVFNFLVFKNKDRKWIIVIHTSSAEVIFFYHLYHVIFKNMKQKLNLSVSSKGNMILYFFLTLIWKHYELICRFIRF